MTRSFQRLTPTPASFDGARRSEGLAGPSCGAVSRVWDPVRQVYVVRLCPGRHYLAGADEAIVVSLGASIAACVRDTRLMIGGMNHFMLLPDPDRVPDECPADVATTAMMYGNVAMEYLLTALAKRGARRENLEVMVFGGGRVRAQMYDVAAQNVAFLRAYLETEGLRLVHAELGGGCPREVLYCPGMGAVTVQSLDGAPAQTVIEQECTYLGSLRETQRTGGVEFF